MFYFKRTEWFYAKKSITVSYNNIAMEGDSDDNSHMSDFEEESFNLAYQAEIESN